MSIIKRNRQDSNAALIDALNELIPLLKGQKEDDAVAVLVEAANMLKEAQLGSQEQKDAVAKIIDAFEGDHELIAYTFQRDNPKNEWTLAEELSQVSARVLSLARRMQ